MAEFLTWWKHRCGRNWAVLTSIVAGIIGLITLHNLATPVVAELRPWATRFEITLVADRLYPRTLFDQQAKTLSLQNRLKWLEERGARGDLAADQWMEIPVIRQAIQDSKDEETRIIKERAYFQMQKEYR